MPVQSFTAVVERAERFQGPFATEPYEVAWAREAVVFLRVLNIASGSRMVARAQVSPDGIEWVDEGAAFESIDGPGLFFKRLTNFGGWLRLVGAVEGPAASADFVVYFALKD